MVWDWIRKWFLEYLEHFSNPQKLKMKLVGLVLVQNQVMPIMMYSILNPFITASVHRILLFFLWMKEDWKKPNVI